MSFSKTKRSVAAPNSSLKIRKFKSEDLPVIQGIRQRAFAPIFEGFREQVGDEIYEIEYADADQQQADYLQTICTEDKGLEIHVASDNDLVIGFIAFSMDEMRGRGEIDLNAVDPDHQGKGAGKLMYEFAIACMKDKGIKLVKVSTGGDASHEAARQSYKKSGFEHSIPSVTLFKII